MSELLPCPFCGNALYTSFSDVWNQTYAQCPSPVGFVGPEVAHGPVGPMTVDRWQDRATPPASPDSKPTGEDSARLDWLAEQFRTCTVHMNGQHPYAPSGPELRNLRGPTFRDAIDHAIARQRAGGG